MVPAVGGVDVKLQSLVESGFVPDVVLRAGIRRLLAERLRDESKRSDDERARFLASMDAAPIALETSAANEQHYEVDPEFYGLVLGPHRKYSCCLFESPTTDLGAAEGAMLALTSERADLRDGQRVLELGCGWGSLSLWMAEHYPRSRITAVSNSHSQRRFIEGEAARRGLANVNVVTADMNTFEPRATFDRVVSVEMFEHMRNWRALLARIANWLEPDGAFFAHVFVHGRHCYPFEVEGDGNWLGRQFFTGGLMPSDDLFAHYPEHLTVREHWRVSGIHYQRTAEAWLRNLDRARGPALGVLARTCGESRSKAWFENWRVFLMACSELWGYRGGEEWFVSHYRMHKR
jgi:cyclopropane-fatty-acyl-phospholipid synthase